MNLFKVAVILAAGLGLAACQTDQPAQPAPLALAHAEPEAPKVTPDRLIGLNETEIKGYFGQPSLKRKEAGAELWQFTGPGCVMDFYLYDENGAKKVSYVTLRDPATGRVGGTACQDQLSKLALH